MCRALIILLLVLCLYRFPKLVLPVEGSASVQWLLRYCDSLVERTVLGARVAAICALLRVADASTKLESQVAETCAVLVIFAVLWINCRDDAFLQITWNSCLLDSSMTLNLLDSFTSMLQPLYNNVSVLALPFLVLIFLTIAFICAGDKFNYK